MFHQLLPLEAEEREGRLHREITPRFLARVDRSAWELTRWS